METHLQLNRILCRSKKIKRQREHSIEVDGACSLTNKAYLFIIMQLFIFSVSTSCPFRVHNLISLGISQDEMVIPLQGIMYFCKDTCGCGFKLKQSEYNHTGRLQFPLAELSNENRPRKIVVGVVCIKSNQLIPSQTHSLHYN